MTDGDRSLLCAILLAMLLSLIPALARAQHNHDAGHAEYQDWASERTSNCCNNQDCGALNDDEWRETTRGTEIRIKGKWCPVKKEHFIFKGRSPDWQHAHACVQNRDTYQPADDCDRLLCFTGAPRF
jgi:hypothetical protein